MAEHERPRPVRNSSGLADPVAIHESFNGPGKRSGEERLMLAVLRDAIECFQQHALSNHPVDQERFKRAQSWIFAKNTSWFFSFENICETLKIDPGYIRKRLSAWKEAKCRSTVFYGGCSMLLREHPLISHQGFHSWPPAWTWVGGMPNQSPRGEVGTLREVHASKTRPKRCFLRMAYQGASYLGCLLIDDTTFCAQIVNLLQTCLNRSLLEIGSIDLSQFL